MSVNRFSGAAAVGAFLLLLTAPCSAADAEMAKKFAAFSPGASAKLVQSFIEYWEFAEKAGINNDLRIQHFIAQVATETGGLRRIDENLSYRPARLLKVFKSRVSRADAQRLAHDPIATANHVYCYRRDLGNGGPNDGWDYRGSGFLQLTGKANFEARGKEVGLPLGANPELARQPREGMMAAAAYWKSKRINAAADKDDLVRVRALVNGGSNGLPEAKIWLARAKRYFAAKTTAPQESASKREEARAVQDLLASMGVLVKGPEESVSRNQFRDALKEFQKSRGIPQTGEYNDETLYKLTDRDDRFSDY
ncbi:hypothetical protein GOC76_30030 [Sinorhizobium medicae]|nr:hypothetical protein [Sinorhizobium medicae]